MTVSSILFSADLPRDHVAAGDERREVVRTGGIAATVDCLDHAKRSIVDHERGGHQEVDGCVRNPVDGGQGLIEMASGLRHDTRLLRLEDRACHTIDITQTRAGGRRTHARRPCDRVLWRGVGSGGEAGGSPSCRGCRFSGGRRPLASRNNDLFDDGVVGGGLPIRAGPRFREGLP